MLKAVKPSWELHHTITFTKQESKSTKPLIPTQRQQLSVTNEKDYQK
jgi:hypothetical protein